MGCLKRDIIVLVGRVFLLWVVQERFVSEDNVVLEPAAHWECFPDYSPLQYKKKVGKSW